MSCDKQDDHYSFSPRHLWERGIFQREERALEKWVRGIKKLLILCLLMSFIILPVLAAEFDTSVDDSIRKNYNPDKLEQDMGLPPLPKVIDDEYKQEDLMVTPIRKTTATTSNQAPKSIQQAKAKTPQQPQQKPQVQQTQAAETEQATPVKISKEQLNCAINNKAVLKKGTRIYAKILNEVSDKSKKGTRVKFATLYPVSTTYFTIPMGTEFYGKIAQTHKPGFPSNGGLIVININSVVLNGEIQEVDAFIAKINHKYIFFNKIKGKNKYLSNVVKSTKNGRHFFWKMMRVTGNLASDGSSIIVAPFSIIAGVLGLGGDILISPVTGAFHKGEPIKVPSGTVVELKLKQDMFITN